MIPMYGALSDMPVTRLEGVITVRVNGNMATQRTLLLIAVPSTVVF